MIGYSNPDNGNLKLFNRIELFSYIVKYHKIFVWKNVFDNRTCDVFTGIVLLKYKYIVVVNIERNRALSTDTIVLNMI